MNIFTLYYIAELTETESMAVTFMVLFEQSLTSNVITQYILTSISVGTVEQLIAILLKTIFNTYINIKQNNTQKLYTDNLGLETNR